MGMLLAFFFLLMVGWLLFAPGWYTLVILGATAVITWLLCELKSSVYRYNDDVPGQIVTGVAWFLAVTVVVAAASTWSAELEVSLTDDEESVHLAVRWLCSIVAIAGAVVVTRFDPAARRSRR